MKYIFIDTNLFIDAVTSNEGENILSTIIKQLNKRSVKIVLPEVIKAEMLTQYAYWKDGVIENVERNLTTMSILGIKEGLTETDKKNKKKNKGETEAEKIDSVIEPHRAGMIKKIEGHYKSITKKIEQVFRHKNTEVVKLTDQILLAGMRRSLLKKSPYTRAEKITESAHTKDVDCIAFEALVAFYKKQTNKSTKSAMIMCVADKDYFSTDGILHDDLKKDIKIETKCYKTLPEMLDKEFKAQIGPKKRKKMKGAENAIGSLASSGGSLVEGSKIVAPQE